MLTISDVVRKWSWDARGRNTVAAKWVPRYARRNDCWPVLDVGAASDGLRAVLRSGVLQLDVLPPPFARPFVRGSASALPFRNRAFPVIGFIDVYEHLPNDQRRRVCRELVRVADRRLIIACPCGEAARDLDRIFQRQLALRDKPIPVWLGEHLSHTYPDRETLLGDIMAGIEAMNRCVSVHVFHDEPLALTRIVRAAAVRSVVAYIALNCLFAALGEVGRNASADHAYRTFVVVDFHD